MGAGGAGPRMWEWRPTEHQGITGLPPDVSQAVTPLPFSSESAHFFGRRLYTCVHGRAHDLKAVCWPGLLSEQSETVLVKRERGFRKPVTVVMAVLFFFSFNRF